MTENASVERTAPKETRTSGDVATWKTNNPTQVVTQGNTVQIPNLTAGRNMNTLRNNCNRFRGDAETTLSTVIIKSD